MSIEQNSFIKTLFENEYASYWIEEGIIVQYFKKQSTDISLQIAKEVVRGRKVITKNI